MNETPGGPKSYGCPIGIAETSVGADAAKTFMWNGALSRETTTLVSPVTPPAGTATVTPSAAIDAPAVFTTLVLTTSTGTSMTVGPAICVSSAGRLDAAGAALAPALAAALDAEGVL